MRDRNQAISVSRPFGGEGDIVGVGREDVVVEALERLAAGVERGDQTAGLRVALEDRHPPARCRQPMGCHQTGQAGADDRDLTHSRRSRRPGSSCRRLRSGSGQGRASPSSG
jgi:hypothetical protein